MQGKFLEIQGFSALEWLPIEVMLCTMIGVII